MKYVSIIFKVVDIVLAKKLKKIAVVFVDVSAFGNGILLKRIKIVKYSK